MTSYQKLKERNKALEDFIFKLYKEPNFYMHEKLNYEMNCALEKSAWLASEGKGNFDANLFFKG